MREGLIIEVTSMIPISSSRVRSSLNTSRSIGSCFIEGKRPEAEEGQGGGVVSGDAELGTGQLNAERELRDSAGGSVGAYYDDAKVVNVHR